MTVSITNPLNDPYYYLNYTAGDHTLTTTAKLGDAVPAGLILIVLLIIYSFVWEPLKKLLQKEKSDPDKQE